MKKEGEKPTCTHCQKKGHDASKCWKLHLELNPKKFWNKEDKNTIAAAIQHDLGSNSGDETKAVSISTQGKNHSFYVSRNETIVEEKEE